MRKSPRKSNKMNLRRTRDKKECHPERERSSIQTLEEEIIYRMFKKNVQN